jgi:enediyne biosynthesis protein E4
VRTCARNSWPSEIETSLADGSTGWNTLYRNNGNGTFTDVSRQAGILRQIGYGLGVVVADVNRDGRPDIYVSNDVSPNDALYINNGNGTERRARGNTGDSLQAFTIRRR